jgi:hypothetical protein
VPTLQTYSSTQALVKNLASDQRVCWSLSLPKGATVTDKGQGMIKIDMPKGMKMVGLDKKTGDYMTLGGYTCTCKSGDGSCQPFVAGDMVGCYTNTNSLCTQCEGKATGFEPPGFQSVKGEAVECTEIFFVHELDNNEPVDRFIQESYSKAMRGNPSLVSIMPVSDPRLLRHLPHATWELFSDNDVKIVSDAFQKQYGEEYKNVNLSGNKVPKGFTLVPIALKGHLAYMVFPKSKLQRGMIELAAIGINVPIDDGGEGSGGTVICSGSCSGGSCHLETKGFGPFEVKYCTGCSSGCTIRF